MVCVCVGLQRACEIFIRNKANIIIITIIIVHDYVNNYDAMMGNRDKTTTIKNIKKDGERAPLRRMTNKPTLSESRRSLFIGAISVV